MTIQQTSDPGISGEWIPVVEQHRAARQSSAAAARRERSMRAVKVAMLALVGFTLLGLGSFAWRRHTMQQEALGEPATAQPVTAQPAD